jgi:excinuclease UvrABC ATPase subunit
MNPRLASITETRLRYLRFGQPATRLSGREPQQLTIAGELANAPASLRKESQSKGMLYVWNEPSPPEEIANNPDSVTQKYLKSLLVQN